MRAKRKIILFDDIDYFNDKEYSKTGEKLKMSFNSIKEDYHIVFCVGISTTEYEIVYDSENTALEVRCIDVLISAGDIVFLDMLWKKSELSGCRESIINKVDKTDVNLVIYTTRGEEEAIAFGRRLTKEMPKKYLGYCAVYLDNIGEDFVEAIKNVTNRISVPNSGGNA